MKHTGSIRFSIDSGLEDVRLLGLAVRGLLRADGFDDDMVDSIELCIVEASNNAVIHAYGREPGHRVEVEMDIGRAEVVVRVVDTGLPMDHWSPPFLEYDADDVAAVPEGGYGLFIIHQVMDAVSYDSHEGKNIFCMTKKVG